MTNQGVNFQLPSGDQISAAVDKTQEPTHRILPVCWTDDTPEPENLWR